MAVADTGASTGMRTTGLGRSDLEVSALIFGCGDSGSGAAIDEPGIHAMLDLAHEAGITTFDTTGGYGDGRSEERLGRWMVTRGIRDRVVVSTKVGARPADDGEFGAGPSARDLREQVEASLRRLGTDRIDLCLARPAGPRPPLEEMVTTFDDLIRAGKIRHYGLSDVDGQVLADTVAAAHRAGTATPVNMQGAYHLADRRHERLALPASQPYGAGFTASDPLGGGLLADSSGARPPARDSGSDHATAAGTIRRLSGPAATRGMAPATLALAWVLSAPHVAGAVITPRTGRQLDDLLAALDVPLTPRDRASLLVSGV
jgi:aryl-alcohol dehydrogenase-like predicted oxidoreductase